MKMKNYIAILTVILTTVLSAIGQSDDYFAREVQRTKPASDSAKTVQPASVTAPVNDNFANAIVVNYQSNGGNLVLINNNESASKEPSEPNHAENAGGTSVWFKFIAPATQNLEIRTLSNFTDFDTTLAVYTGPSLAHLTPFAYNDDCYSANCGTKSRVRVRVIAGTQYYIAVDGYNNGVTAASGSFGFIIQTSALAAFEEDSMVLAYDLGSANAGSIGGTNGLATGEAGEPAHANGGQPGGRSVWYRYKPLSSRAMTFAMTDDFASEMAVYEAPSEGPLFEQMIKLDNSADSIGLNGGRIQTTFFAKSDKHYFIAIDWNEDQPGESQYGTFQLKFYPTKLRYSTRLDRFTGHTALSVFRASEATFYSLDKYNESSMNFQNWGLANDVPIPADFDGDNITDYNVVRNQGGKKFWYCYNPVKDTHTVNQWGLTTDKAVTGDFDKDGLADRAVIRIQSGTLAWYVQQSSNLQLRAFFFGSTGDKPVLGDFDGDGATEVSVARPEMGGLTWHILNSNGNLSYSQTKSFTWGLSTDKPVAEDYDGDGRSDLAVFRPSDGGWYILRSSDGGYDFRNFGTATDKPQPADYDNDGKADIAFYRPSEGNWYIWFTGTADTIVVHWGGSTDIPTASLARLSESVAGF
jgi:hypothetical protein